MQRLLNTSLLYINDVIVYSLKQRKANTCAKLFVLLFFLLYYKQTNAQTPTDSLLFYFQNPPQSARPRVWWHWMNGNITKDGIRKDLEWMRRVGIGGFQNFDANLATPQIVERRLTYMIPEWKDAFRFATQLADSL